MWTLPIERKPVYFVGSQASGLTSTNPISSCVKEGGRPGTPRQWYGMVDVQDTVQDDGDIGMTDAWAATADAVDEEDGSCFSEWGELSNVILSEAAGGWVPELERLCTMR